MSDIVDLAQEVEALLLQRAMQNARVSSAPLIACGQCHNCDAIIPPGMLFCDIDCRDDHSKRQHLHHNPRSPYSQPLHTPQPAQPSATPTSQQSGSFPASIPAGNASPGGALDDVAAG